VVPSGKDELLVRGDLDDLAGRGKLQVLQELKPAPAVTAVTAPVTTPVTAAAARQRTCQRYKQCDMIQFGCCSAKKGNKSAEAAQLTNSRQQQSQLKAAVNVT
jgi:hypothetical protein